MRSYIFTDSEREQAEAEGGDLQVTCNSGFQEGFMRACIFTERERRLLKAWLEGEGTRETRNILSWIRKGWPLLAEDLTLLFHLRRNKEFSG